MLFLAPSFFAPRKGVYPIRLVGALFLALGATTVAKAQLVGTTAGQFSVTPNGGAAYSVPITVPPGGGGMGPKLSIGYSSQGGNGPMGVGFGLGGLSSITRCRPTIAQDGFNGGIHLDGNDRFCLDGQRLVAVSGAYGSVGAEYRTEVDTYSRVTSVGGVPGDPASFRVQTKAGLTMEYGMTASSRIEAVGKTQALAWATSRVLDTAGNYMMVEFPVFSGQWLGLRHVAWGQDHGHRRSCQ